MREAQAQFGNTGRNITTPRKPFGLTRQSLSFAKKQISSMICARNSQCSTGPGAPQHNFLTLQNRPDASALRCAKSVRTRFHESETDESTLTPG